MASLTSGQQQFAGVFARETGLNPRVVGSWLLAEESGSAAQARQQQNNHNWLNIAMTDKGPASGAYSSAWRNPVSAGKAAAEWIRGRGQIAKEYGKPSSGIQGILGSHAQGPEGQISAIANSGWASSGYSGGSTLRSLYSELGGEEGQDIAQAAHAYGVRPDTMHGVMTTEHLGLPRVPGSPARSESTLHTIAPQLNEAAFKGAQTNAALARLFTPSERSGNPLFTTGELSTAEPNAAEYTTPGRTFTTTTTTPATPGHAPQTLSAQHLQPGTAPQGTKLGGFLPSKAALAIRRIDEGQDVQLTPGQALIAPGAGRVVAVKSDPSGFGPDYPVIKIESGPKAGTSWYLGHTDTALKEGDRFAAGQVIARTSRTGHNAPPGWAEIGAGSTIGQGNQGQGAKVRRLLGT